MSPLLSFEETKREFTLHGAYIYINPQYGIYMPISVVQVNKFSKTHFKIETMLSLKAFNGQCSHISGINFQ